MSIIKSLSVGNGDMFYIKHNSDNFTIIDCCICEGEERRILDELLEEKNGKNIVRFISTHPDDDHIRGLGQLADELNLLNFYCVRNKATKKDATDDFDAYCALRDSSKAFFICRDCKRRWMNEKDEERDSSGINILWPILDHADYKMVLKDIEGGGNPNNMSPIIRYQLKDGVSALWMGDTDTVFLEKIAEVITLPKVDILFAPHHGRKSGKVPEIMLDEMKPNIIVIGEAPSEHLHYYDYYNTIKQNSAGDITFECIGDKVHVYVSSESYSEDFLNYEGMNTFSNYIGSITV